MREINQDFETALQAVINELKAPKGQRNSFGNYNYRSAEDIIDAVKPILFEKSLRMKISDSIELVGNRTYVKATVTVIGYGTSDEAIAYAREPETKKGMDEAQITGATSSYARKYALNGMFDIDDTKDADTDEHRKQRDNAPKTVKEEVKPEMIGEALARAKKEINEVLELHDYTRTDQKKAFITMVLEKATIDSIDDAHLVMDALDIEDKELREINE